MYVSDLNVSDGGELMFAQPFAHGESAPLTHAVRPRCGATVSLGSRGVVVVDAKQTTVTPFGRKAVCSTISGWITHDAKTRTQS